MPVITALGGIVLHGAGMASDRTKVTAVTMVLAGLVRHACLRQSGHVAWGSTSPCSFRGRDGGEVAHLSTACPVVKEGVVNTPSFST